MSKVIGRVHVIALVNQKGGGGKTTTRLNVTGRHEPRSSVQAAVERAARGVDHGTGGRRMRLRPARYLV